MAIDLPTEAEWEYAAKGGPNQDPYRYSGSDSSGCGSLVYNNSGYKTQLVGQKQANSLGLYDLSGNVWEWCWDWYGEDYYQGLESGSRNPKGPESGDYRVVRGGSWNDINYNCRVSNRSWSGSDVRSTILVFELPGTLNLLLFYPFTIARQGDSIFFCLNLNLQDF